jgi:diguanylate cyclase (GGDEF)-like protein
LIRQTLADGRTIAINHTPFEGGLWLATYTDITQLRRAEEQWSLLARYDRVTRLPNRFYFHDLLERVLPQLSARQQAGLFHIDIARLEVVAGLFGHAARDTLLQQVAQHLSACAGADNGLARLSDTAFAVLRPGLESVQAAEHFAARLITALSRRFDINGQHLLVSTSIGIAMIPRDGAHADALLTAAEQAMRSAQSEGPGRYRLFQPDMAQSERTHLRVEHELARAIEREEFEVFYQPLVDLRTRRIASFEALVRWRHPVDGLVLPGTFIPVAESNGLMAALSQFVLRRACRDAANWPPEIKVAVNMSATQLRSISAIEWVKAALLESWLPPKRLEIELTESHFLDKRADGLLVLQTLRELGVSIALDDFGTGYASLSSLLAFGFDKLKIDRSFIEGMMEQSERREIVQAMLRLATRLGISSVAEGVQTTEQLQWLRTEGCTEVQSFMLGAPMPAFAVMDVLQRQDALQILVA